jgi:hypothetical protein
MHKKLRHVHISKTAGSALNSVIYKSLNLSPAHISNLINNNDNVIKKPHQLIRKSSAFNFARNNQYLSGHISYSDMKILDGDFIFTMLRDPKQRIVSLYSYALTRVDRGRLSNHNIERNNLLDFINSRDVSNGIFKCLCNDFIKARGHKLIDLEADENTLFKVTKNALKRFDSIYFCSIQETLNDLANRELIPSCTEITSNRSSEEISLGNLGLKQSFLDKLDNLTYLDSLVIRLASDLFPKTVNQKELTNDDFIKTLENRFDCKFMREF